jgi:ABC-2 type transport system permease protein
MKALSIAWKDIQIFFKDRGNLLYLFFLPITFILVFSGALRDLGKGEKDTRIPLTVVNLDGGDGAQTLLAGLDAAGGVITSILTEADAKTQLDEKKILRMLVIPAGFSQGYASGQTVTVRLINHSDANAQETEAVRLVIDGVTRGMSLQSQILRSLEQVSQMQANSPQEFQAAFTTEKTKAQAEQQFKESSTNPLVTVEQSLPARVVEKNKLPGMAEIAVPGFLIMFIFITAQSTASALLEEKKGGAFRRLMAAPLKKPAMLLGKMLPNLVISLIQAAVILLFGLYGLKLFGMSPTSLGKYPFGVFLVIFLIALCSTSFGIMLAAVTRTESQVGPISTIIIWISSILGGCVIPVFLLDQFGIIPKLMPQYWANRALDNLMFRGFSLYGVTTEIGIILGFTAVFLIIGIWRFDFD